MIEKGFSQDKTAKPTDRRPSGFFVPTKQQIQQSEEIERLNEEHQQIIGNGQ